MKSLRSLRLCERKKLIMFFYVHSVVLAEISGLVIDGLLSLAFVFFIAGLGFINTVCVFRFRVFQAAGPVSGFQSLVILLPGACCHS